MTATDSQSTFRLSGSRAIRHTLGDLLSSTSTSLIQLVQRIDSCQDLYCTHGVKHMSVMSRCGAKATVVVLAREHECNSLISRQSIGSAK